MSMRIIFSQLHVLIFIENDIFFFLNWNKFLSIKFKGRKRDKYLIQYNKLTYFNFSI